MRPAKPGCPIMTPRGSRRGMALRSKAPRSQRRSATPLQRWRRKRPARRRRFQRQSKSRSALFVAGPGAQDAIAAAEIIAAAERVVLGFTEVRIHRPAKRSARMLGVDRERGAAAPDLADDLA